MNSTWDNITLFEKLVSDYAGSKYAVAVDSCTNAIFLCLRYCITHGYTCADVNIPKQTYVSVPMQVLHAGYKINFVDNYWEKNYKLDPLPIVDSAQKFEKNMYILNTLYCLSFHSKKTLPIGKGGMILTDDFEAYSWLKNMRHDGRDLHNLQQEDISHIGYHMYMPPEYAARGIELFYGYISRQYDYLSSYKDYPNISRFTCFNH